MHFKICLTTPYKVCIIIVSVLKMKERRLQELSRARTPWLQGLCSSLWPRTVFWSQVKPRGRLIKLAVSPWSWPLPGSLAGQWEDFRKVVWSGRSLGSCPWNRTYVGSRNFYRGLRAEWRGCVGGLVGAQGGFSWSSQPGLGSSAQFSKSKHSVLFTFREIG